MSALVPDSGPGLSLAEKKLIAVLVIDDLQAALPVAEALLKGGVDAMELTLRTPVALEAARLIRDNLPEMMIGIGTILNTEQADQSKDAGADFGVSPGVNSDVMRHAAKISLPFGPGIMTPTDIDIAVREGARLLKFFPAESSGGLSHLKNISAPYAHLGLQFIPLGGIKIDNLKTYLESDLIASVGGSWLAPRDTIRDQDWGKIETNARDARMLIDEISS